jgi:tRNA dimethylallyltransferase
MPIIVGGTGLYVNSLIYEIDYTEIKVDEKYRKQLENIAETEGLRKLYDKACKIDPDAMRIISQNDKKRILRVLEIYHDTGKTKTELEILSRKNEVPYDYRVFAIDIPREILYKRIDARVDLMIKNGLIDEVKQLLQKYKNFPTAMQGIGYKEIKEYLDGSISIEKAIEKIKKESRNYAKRQITWFKKNQGTIWLNGEIEQKQNVKIIQENL